MRHIILTGLVGTVLVWTGMACSSEPDHLTIEQYSARLCDDPPDTAERGTLERERELVRWLYGTAYDLTPPPELQQYHEAWVPYLAAMAEYTEQEPGQRLPPDEWHRQPDIMKLTQDLHDATIALDMPIRDRMGCLGGA